MGDQVSQKEKERRRGIDKAGDALNVIYEQLSAALAPSLQNTRDAGSLPIPASPEVMKRDRDMTLQGMEQHRGDQGKSRLMERRDTQPGETVGDSLERAAGELLEEGQETREPKRSSFKSKAGSKGPGFMSPAEQEEAGIQKRATVGGLISGDTRNESIRRIANERAKRMARGGAAPGLTGATVDVLPKPDDPPITKARSKKLDADAVAKEAAIRDYMETLGVPRDEAIAIWERNRANSDRPTG